MDLVEEKILVAETLMGAKLSKHPTGDHWFDEHGSIYECHYLSQWNPQDDETGHKRWEDIWDKMSYGIMQEYLDNLGGEGRDFYHTAKPSVCWEALVKTIKRVKEI